MTPSTPSYIYNLHCQVLNEHQAALQAALDAGLQRLTGVDTPRYV